MNSLVLIIVAGFLIFPGILYLLFDYLGPGKIRLIPDKAFGMDCYRAGDLIVQEFDKSGNLWATRGMIVYCLRKDDDKFSRVVRVPCGFSFFWLNNFRTFRWLTNKSECIETTITTDGHICALSAGYMWYSVSNGKRFRKVMKLRHYGFGVGRGILSNGLTAIKDNIVLLGEYFRNPGRTDVNIYRINDSGKTWSVAYNFESGVIRHIHSLQVDPYTGKLWICCGDFDSESLIGWFDNDFRKVNQIGTGNQVWRTCQLVFTEEAVYWGTDTGSIELGGIYRWDRGKMTLSKLVNTNGGILYGTRLSGGTIVFSTDREGFANEKDNKTHLYLIGKKDKVSEIECGSWYYGKMKYRHGFGMLRINRGQDSGVLPLTVINQKEFPSGELLLFHEENLISHSRIIHP